MREARSSNSTDRFQDGGNRVKVSPMSTKSQPPDSQAIEALARDLEKLDSATAHAVIDAAREMAHAQWLRQQIRIGEDSGEPVDGPTVMAKLLAEADMESGG